MTDAKASRVKRRKQQPARVRNEQKVNRSRAINGTPNELGVTEGQNAEQGNTIKARYTKPLGKLAH